MTNHQKEVKLKDSTAEFVGPLLNRLKLAQKKVQNPKIEIIIDQISNDVVKKKNILGVIENWDKEVTGCLGRIERQINYWIDDDYERTERNEPTETDLVYMFNQLSEIVNPSDVGTKPRGMASDLSRKNTIIEVEESSKINYQENRVSMVLKWIESLGPQAMSCLYSLAIFPENIELKKRLLIYWWIGMARLGLVSFWEDTSTTAEQYGEFIFSGLVEKGVLIPTIKRKHNKVIDRCIIQPTIHKQLISAGMRERLKSSEERENAFWHLYNGFNLKGLLNLDQRYLTSKDISKHSLHMFQLGRWCYIETKVHDGVEETGFQETKLQLQDHIEVDETDFLKNLGEKVTYLSLQGISGIEELPESVGKLEELMVLDLRACHNLEKLPQKPRSIPIPKLIRRVLPQKRWFKKLKVLDISECYLLEHMPKWFCELSNLEVLKGFVVTNRGTEKQYCQPSDLSKLNKLRKLSIRIAIEHSVLEYFIDLTHLDHVSVLTITWGENKDNNKKMKYSLPKNLEKLDIRCYPKAEASELLNPTTELKNLKRLYIRGGKLTEIPYSDKWKVEILRLRFLTELKTDWDDLRRSFENLEYVEYVKCPNLKKFPEGRSSWIKEKDETLQSDNASETSNQL